METNEKLTSYAMKYQPMYPDYGMVTFKPVEVVKGFYDVEGEQFIVEQTGEKLKCANMVSPKLGNNPDFLINPIDVEKPVGEDAEEDLEPVFAFPIEEQELLRGFKGVNSEEASLEDFYEREVKYYFLFSVYDQEIEDNVFYLTDKDENHQTINVDVSMDLCAALSDGEIQNIVIVYGGGADTEALAEMGIDMSQANPEPEEEPKKKEKKEIIVDFDPDILEEVINSEVINQEHVVKALVSMIYRNLRYSGEEGMKSNMLILGPSGCGKTEAVRSLARNLNIPITFFDASSTSATGYVGNSVTQALRDLIAVCNGDISKAEHGIIFIDEIDKLASADSTGGVSKGDVQDELFKMLEGDVITIPSEGSFDKARRFNTKNVTFIAAGAAQAIIEEKIKAKNKQPMGFGVSDKKAESKDEDKQEEIIIEPKDLIKFGLKPELLRRFSVIKVVNQLREKDLVSILTTSRISNLKLYENAILHKDKVELKIDRSVYTEIAKKASKENAGASGLKRVVDDMFEVAIRKLRLLDGKEGILIMDKDTIEDNKKFTICELNGTKKGKQVYPTKVKKKIIKSANPNETASRPIQ